jgi:hypothetical protein
LTVGNGVAFIGLNEPAVEEEVLGGERDGIASPGQVKRPPVV